VNVKLCVVVGPTAVGKTAVGVRLAKALNGEVINGDASQVYKGLDIGTAKISPEEADGVPHHLIDLLPPEASYSAADFQRDARKAIADVAARGRLPILVGGTGLYIKAAIYDYRFDEAAPDPELRRRLEERAVREGTDKLYERLKEIDPEYAQRVHPNNVKRIVRALERYHLTGRPPSAAEGASRPLYEAAVIGLTMPRDALYRRIEDRVDKMIAAGLVDEARQLYDRGLADAQSTQSIGYKELFGYFQGLYSLDEAIGLIKRNTKRLAKRQYTWFRRQMDVTWFDAKDVETNFFKILQFVAGKLKFKSNTTDIEIRGGSR